MKVQIKIWLDEQGKAFGEGPYELLLYVDKIGSLRGAAKKMGISYKKAWKIIKNCERRLNFPLLERRIGGKMGGGSRITEEGKLFLEKYKNFKDEIRNFVDEAFERHFAGLFTQEKK